MVKVLTYMIMIITVRKLANIYSVFTMYQACALFCLVLMSILQRGVIVVFIAEVTGHREVK